MNRSKLIYAFGHLVASHNPEDPHHADSGDLADDVLRDMGLSEVEMDQIEAIAEHVAGNYRYTGDAEESERRIEAGEL